MKSWGAIRDKCWNGEELLLIGKELGFKGLSVNSEEA